MTGSQCDNPLRSALFTDLYQLTMAQAYDAEQMNGTAVFELFFRRMPPTRNYYVAAGLEDVLAYLENLHVTDDDLAYLREQGQFSEKFLARLKQLRFDGDIYAMREGTAVFANEPLVQVVAPIFEAQLIETVVLNQMHFQSIAATKAARVVSAAEGRSVVDFGSRRAHGADAAMKMARASYLAGAIGTSNVLAGKQYGIPIFGTMAHAYVQSHDDEFEAMAAFAELYPQTTLLVDTYDTLGGVRHVIELKRRMGERFSVRGIRLDSGDLAELAKQSHALLDDAGLSDVQIFASSGLDEYKLAKLIQAGAPIDAFGVGTNMATSDDAPWVDMAYKLVEYNGRPRIKLSSEKVIYPRRKQVFRIVEKGRMVRDVIARHDESMDGVPLLDLVMRGGKRLPAGQISLNEAREHASRQMELLPAHLRQPECAETAYPVEVSESLEKELAELRKSVG